MTKRSWMTMVLAGALAGGCGGGSKAANEPGGGGASAGPSCESAGATFAAGARQSFASMDDATQAELARLTAEACVKDTWSAEAITCTANWTPDSDVDCNELLSDPQKQGLSQAIMPILSEFFAEEEETDSENYGEDMPTEAADPCEGGE